MAQRQKYLSTPQAKQPVIKKPIQVFEANFQQCKPVTMVSTAQMMKHKPLPKVNQRRIHIYTYLLQLVQKIKGNKQKECNNIEDAG